MLDLEGGLPIAGKTLVELIKDIAKDIVVIAALKALGMGADAPQQPQVGQEPIQIEVVMAAPKTAADTAFVLQQGKQAPPGMDKKRFPARTYAVPVALPRQKAMPMLMK